MTLPDSDSHRPEPEPDGGAAPARPYRTPRLECYGKVEDLVRQFGGGPLSDAGSNRMAPFTPPS